MPVAPYLDTLLLLMVAACAVNDLASRRIPNRLLLAGVAGALCLHLASAAPLGGLQSWLGGLATGLIVFLPFYLIRGMAAGDVKMMAAVGAFTGAVDALHIAIMAWCVGGVMALAIVAWRGRLWLALSNMWSILRGALLRLPPTGAYGATGQDSAGSMPYGVAIAAGTMIILISRYD
ncbi:prepilin peptidase [Massilia sp. ST3]|uniref:A24 family peptidase n=1 Tax=Massilia sp. ST3 TaxID=2824903 RepID=UPI001B81C9F9|nr:prepilin peptidase [Massilia sp. ST3]MBQ5948181.1 prepilin peptidase [Massilia sp. ST3]